MERGNETNPHQEKIEQSITADELFFFFFAVVSIIIAVVDCMCFACKENFESSGERTRTDAESGDLTESNCHDTCGAREGPHVQSTASAD